MPFVNTQMVQVVEISPRSKGLLLTCFIWGTLVHIRSAPRQMSNVSAFWVVTCTFIHIIPEFRLKWINKYRNNHSQVCFHSFSHSASAQIPSIRLSNLSKARWLSRLDGWLYVCKGYGSHGVRGPGLHLLRDKAKYLSDSSYLPLPTHSCA